MKHSLFICIILMYTAMTIHAATISPASFCLEKFDIGMNMNLGIDFVMSDVKNTGNIDLKTRQPSMDNILKGYLPIPDASWFYFLNPKIVPDKSGAAKARMFLKIPNENKYLNQHWAVHVTAKPPAMGVFAMEMVGVYMIETKASEKIIERPYGPIGIVPSRIYVKNIVPRKMKSTSFSIYNNDSVSHTYQVSVQTFDPSFYNKIQISQAPGYEWVKYTNWVKPDEPVLTINAGQKKETRLDITIPKDIQYNDEGWEAIIMVESIKKGGPTGFARLLIAH
ncbi:MAG: hypothetical protein HQK75_13580 [Candidatus Magnetomorum sp.]|nr:hypothetical protein [Candidatus Magnetomorum sp.]